MTKKELIEAVNGRAVRMTKTGIRGGETSFVEVGETQVGRIKEQIGGLLSGEGLLIVGDGISDYLRTSRIEKIEPIEWDLFLIETQTSFYELRVL